MEYLYAGGARITVRRKRIKNLILRVQKDGEVTLSAPLRAGNELISSFLKSKEKWIIKKREAIMNAPPARPEEGKIFLWGKEVSLSVTYTEKGKSALDITEDGMNLTVKKADAGKEREVLSKRLTKLLLSEIEKRLPYWEIAMGLKAGAITVRDMKTRWGTCNIKTKKITFALRLTEKPKECLDYIIVHELAHLREANHGEKFKRIVSLYIPDWREIRKKLR